MKPTNDFVITFHDVPENQKQTNEYLAKLLPYLRETFQLDVNDLDTYLAHNQLRVRFTCHVPIEDKLEAIGSALTMNFRTAPTDVTIRLFSNMFEIGKTFTFKKQALQFVEIMNTRNLKHMRNWLEHHAFRDYDVHCPFCNTPIEFQEVFDFDVDEYLVVYDEFKKDPNLTLTDAEKHTYETLKSQTFEPNTVWVCPHNDCARIVNRKAHPEPTTK